jgi:hypothetical protein
MQKLAGLIIFLMLFSAACISVAKLPERAKIQGPLPESVQSVVVRLTTMNPHAIKNVDGLSDAPTYFSRSLKTALEAKQPGRQVRLADEQGAMPDGDIAVATELINIDGGSAGLRFWIGFSAGAAESLVNVTILDKAGKELASAKISARTMCPVGACVESNADTVRRNLNSLASEVAEFTLNPGEYEKKKGSGS